MRQYCTFSAAGQAYGLDVQHVQEVLRYQELTRVPLAPAVVRGLINLRGQIIAALDLRLRLGLPPLPAGRRPVNVVVRTADGPVSLLADEIGDVLELPESALEPPPETLQGTARELIRGTYPLTDRLLLILDLDKIVTPDDGEAVPGGRASAEPPSNGAGAPEYSS